VQEGDREAHAGPEEQPPLASQDREERGQEPRKNDTFRRRQVGQKRLDLRRCVCFSALGGTIIRSSALSLGQGSRIVTHYTALWRRRKAPFRGSTSSWGAGKASQWFPIEAMTTKASRPSSPSISAVASEALSPSLDRRVASPSAIGYRSVHGLRSPAPLVSPWPVGPVASPSLGAIGQAHAPTMRCSRRRGTPSLFQAFVAGAADLYPLANIPHDNS
jgi:hypothetical protein